MLMLYRLLVAGLGAPVGPKLRIHMVKLNKPVAGMKEFRGKLPPLNIENYCQTCIYTSYGYSCSDKVKQLTDSPFKDRVPSGTIEQSQPLTQQNPNEVGEEVSPLQDFSERSSSSKNSVDDNVVDNGQNKEDNAQFEESREIENNTNN
jgi:hypothetical protein